MAATSNPLAFTYPPAPVHRRHGPSGYADYESYRPWLRDEFDFRCVYCLWRENWCADGEDSFSVEHLLSRVAHPERDCDYDNLLYATTKRGSRRRQTATSPPPSAPDVEVLTLAEAAAYLRVAETAVGQLMATCQIPGRQIGGQWRFLKSALQAWLATPPALSGKEALLSQAAAMKDDPFLDELLEKIYKDRGRPMVEEPES